MNRSESLHEELLDAEQQRLLHAIPNEIIEAEGDISDFEDHLSIDNDDTQSEQSAFSESESDDIAPPDLQPVVRLHRLSPDQLAPRPCIRAPQPARIPLRYPAVRVPFTGTNFDESNDHTRWNRVPFPQPAAANLPAFTNQAPTTTMAGRRGTDFLSAWAVIIDDQMIQEIVAKTNIKIRENRETIASQPERRDATYADVDDIELKAVFGLLYLAGLHKSSHINLHELWTRDGSGIEMFRLTMSEQGFRFIIRSLRFDDQSTRDGREEEDKLAAIRSIFEQFRLNSIAAFKPGDSMCVDEMLDGFRGNCPFRQYMPRKPARYGIKYHALCDVKTAYTFNMEIYVGLQREGRYRVSNRPEDIVLRLVEPLGTCRPRLICTDNWYTSLSLAENLLRRDLYFLGTVRKNRRFVPRLYVSKEINRPLQSSMFGYRPNATLVSYRKKRNVFILLLTTLPKLRSDLIAQNDQ